MKAALCIRADARENPGGDWVQLQKTAAALEEFGVSCEIHVGTLPRRADVVHAFNLTRLSNTLKVAAWAKAHATPLAISPIWHSLDDMSLFYGHRYRFPEGWFPIASYLASKELLYERGRWDRHVLRAALFWRAQIRRVVAQAAIVLPNSPDELQALRRQTGAAPTHALVVPNAVDAGACFADTLPRQRMIVCAGRIEPRKNTLRVVRAFLQSAALRDWKLLLLGHASDRHADYVRQVMRQVDGQRIIWRDQIPFAEAQQCYAESHALILASHFETTGLVGLEGLFQGCQVVMTRRCYTDYYYGDRVLYCDPYDTDSIQLAMEQATTRLIPRPDDAFFQHFSWANVGRLTANAYEIALQAFARHEV